MGQIIDNYFTDNDSHFDIFLRFKNLVRKFRWLAGCFLSTEHILVGSSEKNRYVDVGRAN